MFKVVVARTSMRPAVRFFSFFSVLLSLSVTSTQNKIMYQAADGQTDDLLGAPKTKIITDRKEPDSLTAWQ